MKIYACVAVVVFLFAGANVCAQNTDSLKKKLAKITSPAAQSRMSYAIGVQYFDKDQFDSSIAYFRRSAQIAKGAGYDTMYMEAYGFMSAVLREAGSNDESLLYCDTATDYARHMHLPMRVEDFLVEKASTLLAMGRINDFAGPIHEALTIAQANNSRKEEARIYWVTAIYYDDLNDDASELDYVNRAMVIFDSLKMYRRVADGYRFISGDFSKRKKWLDAVHYAKIADSIYATLGMNSARNALLMDMGIDYKNMGQYDIAITLYERCIDSLRNDEYMQMLAYSNLAIAQSESGSFTAARKSFDRALQLNKNNDPAFNVSVYTELGKAFVRTGKIDSALYYAKRAEGMSGSSNNNLEESMDLILLLRNIYEAKKDMGTALTYDKQYGTLQDSMYRVMLQKNVADADARVNLTEKNRELSALSAENELQKVKAEQQRSLTFFLTVGLCLGGIIVVLIVTAYRRTLKKNRLLAQQKQELQRQKQELQQQKDIIDAQVIQLAGAAKMKSKFLANISHELRTPVTLLSGMLEIMSTGKKQEPAKEKKRLDIAYNNSRKLQQMVEEILELTKLENNKSEPVYEVKEAAPLVRRIVYAFETLIEREGLVLEYDDERAKGLYISVDTGKFEKVLNNLVYNAIKFNKKGGHIIISLYPADYDKHLCIDVTDTGIGIAATDLPHIFEHFYQGETMGLKAAGAGIGLSLVKEFTSLMGGIVQVHSKQGEGTTFILQYDIVPSPSGTKPQPDNAPELPVKEWNPFALRQKVLIVEDNEEMRYYLQDVLGEYVEVTTAGNGIEGLDCLEHTLPDLIISDVMMPGMDGREFVNRLKADDRFKKIPVITLTALADMETQLSFLRLGVDDYMVKPFNAEELRIRVYNLLANQAERKAFREQPAEPGDVQEGSKEAEDFRRRVTEYVLASIKNINVSVTDLAYELAMSERQLYRHSKSLTGYTPAQLIKEIRLQKAYELLLSGDIYKVEDVCKRVGYEKASYFAQQFYERFGKRPSEFL